MSKASLLLCVGLAAGLTFGCSGYVTVNNGNSANAPASNANTTNANAASANTASTNAAGANTASTGGTVYTHQEGGIQFASPAGWKEKQDGQYMTLLSPDEELEVDFFVPPNDDFEQATKDVLNDLDKYLKNAKITGEGTEGTHNGMKTYSVQGTGDYEGKPNVWDLTILGAKKPVFVLSIATPENFPKYKDDYTALINSIKPVQ